jgi:hypothetical protein
MFGWINDCTEKLVISKFGVESWHAIKAKAGCEVSDGGFIRHEYYPDASTVQLVVAASELLGLTVDQVLEAFGTFFMEFVRAEGYENLLQCQGNTLSSWLSNMNALHDHLESSLPRGMVKPVFWCETPDPADADQQQCHHSNNINNNLNDTSSKDDEDYMILHYYSKRGNLLVPLVVGVVKEVARYHFDVVIEMILLQKQAVDGATHTRYDSYMYKLTYIHTYTHTNKHFDTCILIVLFMNHSSRSNSHLLLYILSHYPLFMFPTTHYFTKLK